MTIDERIAGLNALLLQAYNEYGMTLDIGINQEILQGQNNSKTLNTKFVIQPVAVPGWVEPVKEQKDKV